MAEKKKKKPLKRTQKEREKYKRERDLSDIRHVAKSPEGRRFIWRILSRSYVFSPNGATDAITMAKIEGAREKGIELLTDVAAAKSTLYSQMQQEFASEKESEKVEIKKERENRDPLSIVEDDE